MSCNTWTHITVSAHFIHRGPCSIAAVATAATGCGTRCAVAVAL